MSLRLKKIIAFFMLSFPFISGCTKHSPETVLQLPIVSYAEEQGGEVLYLRIFSYWGRTIPKEELYKAFQLPWKPSALERLCKENDMICLPLVCDLNIAKKLLKSKIPILVNEVRDIIAPAWGSVIYESYIGFIIVGYNEGKNLVYLIYDPSDQNPRPYPTDLLSLSFWAGRKEALMLVIAPKEKEMMLKNLIPQKALQRGIDLLRLIEIENLFVQDSTEYQYLLEQVKSFMREREELLERHPRWSYAKYLVGYPLFFLFAQREEGLKLLEDALRLENSPFYYTALATAYLSLGDYKKAEKAIQGSKRTGRERLNLSSAFVNTYIQVKRGYINEAERDLRKIIKGLDESNPLRREFELLYALLKFEEGKPYRALEMLEDVVKGFKNFSDFALLFNLYLAMEKYNEANRLLLWAKKNFRGNNTTRYTFEMYEQELALSSAESMERKLEILKKIEKFRPVSYKLLFTYISAGQIEEAKKHLSSDKYLDLKRVLLPHPRHAIFGPPYDKMEAAEILTAQGIIAFHEENREKAKGLFQQAIKYGEEPLCFFNPFHANALLTPKAYLGMIYYEEGNEAMARQYLREAFSKNVPFLGEKEAREIAQKLGLL